MLSFGLWRLAEGPLSGVVGGGVPGLHRRACVLALGGMNGASAAEPRLSGLGRRIVDDEPVITRLMTAALSRPELLSLAAGFTDNSRLPVAAVQRALDILRESDPENTYLQYGQNRGDPGLRAEVAKHLRSLPGEDALDVGPDDVVVTNGSQQLLYISAQLFCEPGDTVWVQAPSYFVFLELLRGLGVRPLSIPTTAEGGIDFDACRKQLRARRAGGGQLRLVYLMGAFANPSTRSLSEADKRGLARVIREESPDLPVVEDMAYRELYFGQAPAVPSMLAMEVWQGHPVLYAGTLTKPFATGLKIGYGITFSRIWREGVERIKGHQDFGSAEFAQAILREVMVSGDYKRHLEAVRPFYGGKAALLGEILGRGGLRERGWRWESPEGGLLLWLRGPGGLDTSFDGPLWREAMEASVLYVPGDLCFAEGAPRHFVRLSFGALPSARIEEAALRFVRAAKKAAGVS